MSFQVWRNTNRGGTHLHFRPFVFAFVEAAWLSTSASFLISFAGFVAKVRKKSVAALICQTERKLVGALICQAEMKLVGIATALAVGQARAKAVSK